MVLPREVVEKVTAKIDAMRDEIINLCTELVRIPSVTPTYLGVDPKEVLGGETKVARHLARIWENMGFATDIWDAFPQRANAVGKRKGSSGGRSLMVIGHMDVVPVPRPEQWKHDPFGRGIEQGKIFGRGSVDMKQGLAAQTMAARALLDLGFKLNGDLMLAGTVGEETMDGAVSVPQVIDKGYRPDAAIHTEPADDATGIWCGCGGLLWLRVTVRGKSTHSLFRYELVRAGGKGAQIGVSAIDKAIKIYSALLALENDWGLTKRHRLLPPGHSTIAANVIRGGPGDIATPFIIPDYCSLDYCIWYPPDHNVEDIQREIEEQIKSATVNDQWLKEHPPEVEWKLHWPPYLTPEDHDIVKTVRGAHELVTGKSVEVLSSPAVFDGSFTAAKGIPSIAYGAGGDGLATAHAVDEFVRIDDLIRCTKVLALTMLEWCGYEK